MIKIAMLGADSSHVEAYAELMNFTHSPFYGRGRVVTLWGEDSQQAAEKARQCEIERTTSTPEEAISGVDLVMVEARYGDDHFRLAKLALEAGLPTFVDKPLTNNLNEAQELISAARNVPLFSCSPLRHAAELAGLDVTGWTTGAVAGLSSYPSLGERANNIYFYGIHLIEMLFTVFGRGVELVSVHKGALSDTAIVRYPDSRLVSLYFLREAQEIYHVTAYLPNSVLSVPVDAWGNFYETTLDRVLTFAETGTAPVAPEETLEGIALLSSLAEKLAT